MVSNEKLDQLMMLVIDLHSDLYPHDERLAKARVAIRRHLRKRIQDNEIPDRNHQGYVCLNCSGMRFWVEGHDGDAMCPRCASMCGMD